MRCRVCKRDNGWGGSTLCKDHEIIYGCKVKIIDGFYRGQEGVPFEETFRIRWDDDSRTGINVKLTDGRIVNVPEFYLERIV